MKRIVTLFSMLAVTLLLGSLPALAGSGPYGTFGPLLESDWSGTTETERVAIFGGSGPYGVFGPVQESNIIPGADRETVTVSWGSGPYGVFSTHGMVARDKANRHECLLVAMNYCPIR